MAPSGPLVCQRREGKSTVPHLLPSRPLRQDRSSSYMSHKRLGRTVSSVRRLFQGRAAVVVHRVRQPQSRGLTRNDRPQLLIPRKPSADLQSTDETIPDMMFALSGYLGLMALDQCDVDTDISARCSRVGTLVVCAVNKMLANSRAQSG